MKLRKNVLLFIILFIVLINNFVYADEVNLNATSAILIEVSTGKVIFERNSREKKYPASITKIMTAIIILENCELSDKVTVSQSALSNIPSGYVTCDLLVGEEISVEDLLYALMVKSANDAAYVLAEHVGGSVEGFSEMMNEKAKELGCTGTHFVNPNGIHDENHYTTANDMYLMANYAMKKEEFRKLVSTTKYTLPITNLYSKADRSFSTTNSLIDEKSSMFYKDAIGIKTGFTTEAGECLVAECSRDGLDFIAVILDAGSPNKGNRFVDAKRLFNYGYDNYTLSKIREKDSHIETIEIKNGNKETKDLDVLIDSTVTVLNNKSLDISGIVPEITYNEEILAPIQKGDIVGKIEYEVEGIEYEANLIAGAEVIPKPDYSLYIIIAGFVILIIGFIILRKNKNKRRKRR